MRNTTRADMAVHVQPTNTVIITELLSDFCQNRTDDLKHNFTLHLGQQVPMTLDNNETLDLSSEDEISTFFNSIILGSAESDLY
jgi:hypothetical protein